MPQSVEWVVTAERRVVLALDDRLPAEPTRAEVTGRGLLLVETADGASHSYQPNRKVAGTLRRVADVVITEPPSGASPRRTTILATAPAAPAPGARA